MTEPKALCVFCGVGSEEMPLILMDFRGEQYWICPQHLPILIHKPEKLAEHFPGIEKLEGIDHEH
jgi:hypothetical protein